LQEVWTLCRIFKRVPSYRKYAPNWKETASKLNPSDSSSKTCSLESENYISFEDSVIQQNESKPFIQQVDQRNLLNSAAQAPFPSSYSSLWSPSADDLFTNGNWDELRSVVQVAVDPSQVYECR